MIDAPAQATSLTSVRRRSLPFSERRLVLIVLDVVAVSVAFVIAFNLHTTEVRGVGFSVPRMGTLITVAVYLACAHMASAYDLRIAGSTWATTRVVLTTIGFAVVALLGVFFIVPYQITRPTLLLWTPLAAGAVLSGRFLYRRCLGAGYHGAQIALVMTRDGLEHIWPRVNREIGGFFRVTGVVDPSRADCADRLRTLVANRSVEQIVLGVGDHISGELFAGVLRCHDSGVTVRSVADVYEELTGRLLLDQLGHTWLMSLPMRSETSRLYGAFKRSIDVVAACLALVLLAVALPVVALGILIEDRGPIFYRQVRVGQYGRRFQLTKLRTMRPSGHSDWTEVGDPRVTRVGAVLRRLHVDELPQAWNILRGDMSLIGPRPEQPQYVEELGQQIDYYNTRHTVRPGLTGWAQANYGYGSGIDGTRTKLAYDLYYVKRQSVSLDLLVMARTLLTVLKLGGR